MTTPTLRGKASAFAATTIVLLGGATGCSGGEKVAGADGVCGAGNDYLWYLQRVGGQRGDIPDGNEAEPTLDNLRATIDRLSGQVPSKLDDEVQVVDRVWDAIDTFFAKYDYDEQKISRHIDELSYGATTQNRAAGERLVGWIYDTCDQDPDNPDDFPTTPADAP